MTTERETDSGTARLLASRTNKTVKGLLPHPNVLANGGAALLNCKSFGEVGEMTTGLLLQVASCQPPVVQMPRLSPVPCSTSLHAVLRPSPRHFNSGLSRYLRCSASLKWLLL